MRVRHWAGGHGLVVQAPFFPPVETGAELARHTDVRWFDRAGAPPRPPDRAFEEQAARRRRGERVTAAGGTGARNIRQRVKRLLRAESLRPGRRFGGRERLERRVPILDGESGNGSPIKRPTEQGGRWGLRDVGREQGTLPLAGTGRQDHPAGVFRARAFRFGGFQRFGRCSAAAVARLALLAARAAVGLDGRRSGRRGLLGGGDGQRQTHHPRQVTQKGHRDGKGSTNSRLVRPSPRTHRCMVSQAAACSW